MKAEAHGSAVLAQCAGKFGNAVLRLSNGNAIEELRRGDR